MQTCPRCGIENPDEVIFCNLCGFVLKADEGYEDAGEYQQELYFEEVELGFWGKLKQAVKKSVFFRRPRNIFFTGVVALLVIVIALGAVNFGYFAFMIEFDAKNYAAAHNIYAANSGNGVVMNLIERYLEKEALELVQDFSNNEITYQDTTIRLDKISQKISVPHVFEKIDKIERSRNNYRSGISLIENGHVFEGLLRLKQVVSTDINYDRANHLISEYAPTIKNDMIKTLDQYKAAKNFEKALPLIDQMKTVYIGDEELAILQNEFMKIKKDAMIKEYKQGQLLVVESAYTAVQENGVNGACVNILNKSDKTVKKFYVDILMFDDKGSTVKNPNPAQGVGYSNMANAFGEKILPPGKRFNADDYWPVPAGVKKIKAVVHIAEFDDGTTWINPYADLWAEQEFIKY